MNQPLDKDNLPASLNAMTFLCAAVSTAAAALAAVPYVTQSSSSKQAHVVSASPNPGETVDASPSAPQAMLPVQPILEDTPALVLPPVETVVNGSKPKDLRAEVLASVESKPIQSSEDLALAFKSAAQLQQTKKSDTSRKVATVTAPEYREASQNKEKETAVPPKKEKASKSSEKTKTATLNEDLNVKPTEKPKPPAVNPKAMTLPAVPKNEEYVISGNSQISRTGELRTPGPTEQPQNFRPLDVAQKQAENKTPPLNTQSSKGDNTANSYQGPSVVAMSADRVWVRVGETRTAVLVVGDVLAGVGKVTSINAGVVKFDNGMSKSVGDLIK